METPGQAALSGQAALGHTEDLATRVAALLEAASPQCLRNAAWKCGLTLDASGQAVTGMRDALPQENAMDAVLMDEKATELKRWRCGICLCVAEGASKPHCSAAPCECVALYCAHCLGAWLASRDTCPSCKRKAECTYQDRSAQEDIKALPFCQCPDARCQASGLTFDGLLAHLEEAHDAPARRQFQLEAALLTVAAVQEDNERLRAASARADAALHDFADISRQVAQLSDACLRKDELVEKARYQRAQDVAAWRRLQDFVFRRIEPKRSNCDDDVLVPRSSQQEEGARRGLAAEPSLRDREEATLRQEGERAARSRSPRGSGQRQHDNL
jgi:hypothetical protein